MNTYHLFISTQQMWTSVLLVFSPATKMPRATTLLEVFIAVVTWGTLGMDLSAQVWMGYNCTVICISDFSSWASMVLVKPCFITYDGTKVLW